MYICTVRVICWWPFIASELIALIVLVMCSDAEEQEIGLMNDRTVIAAVSQQQQQQPITADPGLSITCRPFTDQCILYSSDPSAAGPVCAVAL